MSAHRSGLQFQPLGDLGAELVALDGDPLHVGARRRQVLVPERVLRLDDAARRFGCDTCCSFSYQMPKFFISLVLAASW
jgi:hypothetical protein